MTRKFKKPRRFTHNLIIAGAGSAGLVAAVVGSAVRARVALVEKDRQGGDCLHRGCVPSKTLIRSANIAHYLQRAGEFGIQTQEAKVDFARVMQRVREVIQRIEPHDSVERYQALGVDCHKASARLTSPWEVDCGKVQLSAPNIILATGAEPLVPPIPGLDDVPWLTSDTLWQETELPERLLVLGGGPIGCELAQAFARLGASVTLVEMAASLLPREDPETQEIVAKSLTRDGVKVMTSHRVASFSRDAQGSLARLTASPAAATEIRFDRVLLAAGRRPVTENLGLADIGITLEQDGRIKVDKYLRTSVKNIFAAGDVTGPFQFTHMAAHQSWHAGVNALFGFIYRFRVKYSAVPWTTYTDPEVATVGLTEQQAKALGRRFEVTRFDLSGSDRAMTDGVETGFIKVLTPPGRDTILGATLVGHRAGEMLAEYVLAMTHGLGLRDILATIHAYPTLTEVNKSVAGVWRRSHAPGAMLRLAEKLHAWRRG